MFAIQHTDRNAHFSNLKTTTAHNYRQFTETLYEETLSKELFETDHSQSLFSCTSGCAN